MRYFQIEHALIGRFGKMEMELAAEAIRLSGDETATVAREEIMSRASPTDHPHVLAGLDELITRGWLVPIGEEEYAVTPEFQERICRR